jgi:hypothetical protein
MSTGKAAQSMASNGSRGVPLLVDVIVGSVFHWENVCLMIFSVGGEGLIDMIY